MQIRNLFYERNGGNQKRAAERLCKEVPPVRRHISRICLSGIWYERTAPTSAKER